MDGSRAAPHFQFRPDTQDWAIFNSVVQENEYRLPRRFEPTDVIVDIGGHIGSFSHAALMRGAGQVFTFEAAAHNLALLQPNLTPFGRRSVVRGVAVFRSDWNLKQLPFGSSSDRTNTGGGSVCHNPPSQLVPAVKFDDVIDEVTRQGQRRVRLVKLDCEGSEWPILLTSQRLKWIDAICGEYHIHNYPAPLRVKGYDHFSTELLREVLTAQGFRVDLDPMKLPVGLFFAWRTGVAAFAPVPRLGVLQVAAKKSRRLLGALLRLFAPRAKA